MVFGVASRTVKNLRGVPDFIAGNEAGDAGADTFDDARNVMPGNGGQGHIIGIITAPDLIIQRVDGGCVDTDKDLSGLRDGHGDVLKFKRFRAAKGFEYLGFHCLGFHFATEFR